MLATESRSEMFGPQAYNFIKKRDSGAGVFLWILKKLSQCISLYFSFMSIIVVWFGPTQGTEAATRGVLYK